MTNSHLTPHIFLSKYKSDASIAYTPKAKRLRHNPGWRLQSRLQFQHEKGK
jgi:hypothetical protein